MKFSEWFALVLNRQDKELEDFTKQEIGMYRRAFQAGEVEMRRKAAQVIESIYANDDGEVDHPILRQVLKDINTLKIDGG